MPRLPNTTPRRIVRFFEAEGFVLDHVSGSHHIFYHPDSKKRAVIPMHAKDLPKGTLLAILRQTGYTKSDLAEWLGKVGKRPPLPPLIFVLCLTPPSTLNHHPSAL